MKLFKFPLTLRTGLAASYLAVVALFCVTLLALFPLFQMATDPAVRRSGLVPPPHEIMRKEVVDLLSRQSPNQDRQKFLEACRGTPELDGATILLFHRHSAPERLSGSLDFIPEPPACLWSGQPVDLFFPKEGFVVYQPSGQDVLAAARPFLDSPSARPSRNQAFLTLIACTVFSGSLCFGVGLILSSRLTRPLSKMSEAVRRFGNNPKQERLEPQGPPELRSLATAFNEMAENLESSLESLRCERNRALALEATQRQFLGDVSHNLGTPLAAVCGWVDMLVDGMVSDPQEVDVLLLKTRREVHHISKTVRQLLELSRWKAQTDSGKLNQGPATPMLSFENFALLEPLMEVVDNLADAAKAQEIELDFQGLHPRLLVRADRTKVREMLQIALENVVEHAGRSTALTVAAHATDKRIQINIQDNGPGLPPEILEWYSQNQDDPPSDGLGLAILRRLALAHGGQLTLESQPGRNIVGFSLENATSAE